LPGRQAKCAVGCIRHADRSLKCWIPGFLCQSLELDLNFFNLLRRQESVGRGCWVFGVMRHLLQEHIILAWVAATAVMQKIFGRCSRVAGLALQFRGAPPAPTFGIGSARGPPFRPRSPARICRKSPSPLSSAHGCATCSNSACSSWHSCWWRSLRAAGPIWAPVFRQPSLQASSPRVPYFQSLLRRSVLLPRSLLPESVPVLSPTLLARDAVRPAAIPGRAADVRRYRSAQPDRTTKGRS
jgi:hypothetical protein